MPVGADRWARRYRRCHLGTVPDAECPATGAWLVRRTARPADRVAQVEVTVTVGTVLVPVYVAPKPKLVLPPGAIALL